MNADGVCRRALPERACVSPCFAGKGVCRPAYRREGVYVCVLPCLCRRKLRRQITGDAMYRRVEIARKEGCRALREIEKSTRLRR